MIITDPNTYPATIDVTIKNPDRTTSTINVQIEPDALQYEKPKENPDEIIGSMSDWAQKTPEEKINRIADELKKTFENLPEQVFKDFQSEGIKLCISAPGDTEADFKTLGQYYPTSNMISLIFGDGFGFMNGIRPETLVHEIGHAVDFQGKIYTSTSSTTSISEVLDELQKNLPDSLKNNYAYKNLGHLDHLSNLVEGLKKSGAYDKCKPILDKLEKEYQKITASDKKSKANADKEENKSWTPEELIQKNQR